MNVSENTNVTEQDEIESPFAFVSKNISFILLLTFVIPSILMHLIVFILIFFNKTLRSASHNYIVLFILFYSFILSSFITPTVVDSHRSKPTIRWSMALCKTRSFLETVSFCTMNFLVAWASFERHLLIFHSNIFNVKWKNVCFHYIPPILIIIIYQTIFYIYCSFFFPCETQVDFVNNICYYGCQSRDPLLGMWQTSFHNLFPVICIFICNRALLLRVSRSKTRLQQSINWRKYRTMIFQLASVAFLYLSFNLPFYIVYIWVITTPSPMAVMLLQRTGFFTYFVPFLFPFACFLSIPQLGSKMKKIVHCRTVRVGHEMQLRAIRLGKT